MANYNTTLMYILQSELINSGFSEFKTKNRLVFTDDKYQFIKKIMRYDDDVDKIFTRIVFQEERLISKEGDRHFKKLFLNKFLDRQIKKQTVEAFSAKVLSIYLMYEDYLNLTYNELDKFVLSQSETITKGNRNSIYDDRNASSELAQDEVNIDVDNTILEYGNYNSISRKKDISEDDSTTITNKHTLDELFKVERLLKNVFREFDKNCFAQIF